MSHKAWQNAHAMYENDACAKALGIDIISMDEGFAVVTMTVTAQMLNGHQSCHGGQLFSLADTAFAYACNSQGWQPSLLPARLIFTSRLCRRHFNCYCAGSSSGQANRCLRHRNC